MKKIYMLAIATILVMSANAQTYDVSVAFDNVGSSNSDDPVDFTFTVTNEGVDIPAPSMGNDPDTLYVAIVINLSDIYSIGNTGELTLNQYTAIPLTTGFTSGQSTQLAVSSITMQEMYEDYLAESLTGNICASTSVGYSLFSGYGTDVTPADNGACTSYTVTEVAGVDESTETSEISAYPNPASSILNIDLGNNSVETINVVDMTGRTIKTISVTNGVESIDVLDLENGVYFYLIMVKGKAIKTEKFIVSK